MKIAGRPHHRFPIWIEPLAGNGFVGIAVPSCRCMLALADTEELARKAKIGTPEVLLLHFSVGSFSPSALR